MANSYYTYITSPENKTTLYALYDNGTDYSETLVNLRIDVDIERDESNGYLKFTTGICNKEKYHVEASQGTREFQITVYCTYTVNGGSTKYKELGKATGDGSENGNGSKNENGDYVYYDCMLNYSNNEVIKEEDDITIIGLHYCLVLNSQDSGTPSNQSISNSDITTYQRIDRSGKSNYIFGDFSSNCSNQLFEGSGKIYRWDGSKWIKGKPYRWDGSKWIKIKKFYRWDGSKWIKAKA